MLSIHILLGSPKHTMHNNNKSLNYKHYAIGTTSYPKTSKINDIARAYSLAFWLSEDITMNRTQKRV